MLQIKELEKNFQSKKKVVAVSPLIGNKAVSGPAGDYMEAAGIETNAYGLAKMYSDVCSNIVIDSKDKLLTKKFKTWYESLWTKILMKNKGTKKLASFILKQVRV